MNVKKMLSILLVILISISLISCGSSTNEIDKTVNTKLESSNKTEVESAESSIAVKNDINSETVKIGLVTAITGTNSLVGEEAIEGANLAIDEINSSGGIDGKLIELVITDEVDNLEMSVIATQELLSNNEISGIIGSMYSTYCIAAIPAVNDAKVPFISMGSSSGVSNEGSEFVWQNRPLDTAQGAVLADYVVNELGVKKPAILHSTQSALLSLADQTINALKNQGLEITDNNIFAFPEDESNFSPYISQIMAGDFDCLIAMSNQAPSAIICQQVQAAGLTSDMMPLIGSTSFCSSVCLENAGIAANNWYSVADWVPGGSNSTAEKFEKKYVETYPDRPNSDLASACVYDAVYIFAEAMKIAGTTTDHQKINDAMQKVDFEGAMSYFNYYEDHSFANTLTITQNINQKPEAIKAVTYR